MDYMSPGVAGGAAAVALLTLLRMAFPIAAPTESDRSLTDLGREYRTWYLVTVLLYFVSATATVYIFYRALSLAGTYIPTMLPEAAIVLTPAGSTCAIVALLLGIGAGLIPVDLLCRALLRERYPEFQHYNARLFGVDPRFQIFFFYVYAAICIIGLALAAGWNVRLTEHAIVVNPLWSFSETSHPYTDVISIRTAPLMTAPSGNVVDRREYAVRFRDGSTWSTNLDPSDASPAKKREVIDFISQHAGVPVTEVDVLGREEVY